VCGGKVSDTTARTRRDEWVAAGVVEPIVNEARSGSDTIVGRDLSDTAVDGSRHTCPSGGEGTGKNPRDRSTLGREWPVLTDPAGIPMVKSTRSCKSPAGHGPQAATRRLDVRRDRAA
jgi:hypothetical protein